jgi:DNA-binding MarR family transcriptional regulator
MVLPPAPAEEVAWDILLALHSDKRCELSLDKLGSIVSVPLPVLTHWLARLERRQLVAGAQHGSGQELWAVLTPAGRELLNCYLSAMSSLQVGDPN